MGDVFCVLCVLMSGRKRQWWASVEKMEGQGAWATPQQVEIGSWCELYNLYLEYACCFLVLPESQNVVAWILEVTRPPHQKRAAPRHFPRALPP